MTIQKISRLSLSSNISFCCHVYTILREERIIPSMAMVVSSLQFLFSFCTWVIEICLVHVSCFSKYLYYPNIRSRKC